MTPGPASGLVQRLRLGIAALRLPADTTSEAGRAQMRHRAIALTALAAAAARILSIGTALAAVPLTLHYLGTERYGMWMTLSAFSALLSFADFGIGNSILTAVAHTLGRGEGSELRRQISSAFAAMGGMALLMLGVLAAVYPLVAWDRLFNVSDPLAVAEAGPAAAVFFVILAMTVPLGLVIRVQLGLQQGFRANLWQGAGSLAALAALLAAIRLEASLPWLVLALAGTPVLLNLVNSLVYFGWQRPDLRPRLAACDLAAIRRLAADGFLFLILQVCAAVMFQINALIIAQLLGPEAVATYAVPERLFALITTAMMLFLTPLWPAYGDAAARGDIAWLRRTLRRSLVGGIAAATALALVLVIAAPSVLHWWVGDAVQVPFALIAGFGVWKVIETAGNAVAMFLNGLNQLNVQVVLALINALASVALKIWWVDLFGLPGIMAATIAAYAVLTVPFLGLAARRALAAVETRSGAAA